MNRSNTQLSKPSRYAFFCCFPPFLVLNQDDDVDEKILFPRMISLTLVWIFMYYEIRYFFHSTTYPILHQLQKKKTEIANLKMLFM